MTSKPSTFKILPIYLQPRILSAVSYIHQSPNTEIGLERINRLHSHLNEKEIMWVMSLLTFEKLLDLVKDSDGFKNFSSSIKERTVH